MNKILAIITILVLSFIANHLSGSLIILQPVSEEVTIWINEQYYDTQDGYFLKFDDFPLDENFEIDGNNSSQMVFKFPVIFPNH